MANTAQVLEQQAAPEERRGLGGLVYSVKHFAVRKPVGAVSAVILAFIILTAAVASFVAPYGEVEPTREGLQGPRSGHLFGTDRQGRDIFSRVLYGAQVSVTVGFVSVAVSTVIASAVGLFSGYFGGWTDNILMRLNDILMAFPSLILALTFMAVFGQGLKNLIIIITILNVPYIARVARAAVISIKENQYVEAAQAIGARDLRIVFRHVFPNIVPVLIVYGGTYIGYSIVAEASLSFLGVGVQPTEASWGGMLTQDQARSFMKNAPYLVVFPAIALTLTVLSANLFADALRDHLDPRLRGSR